MVLITMNSLPRKIKFSHFEIDLDAALIRDGGVIVEVEPQVFDLVAFLCLNAGRLIPYDEIIESVWRGRTVSESTIATRINAARRALGDNGTAQNVIRTVRGRGLRFQPIVKAEAPAEHVDFCLSAAARANATADAFDGRPYWRLRSIAVLPFRSMSNELDTKHFAEGLVEELITGLSQIAQLTVISPTSATPTRFENAGLRALDQVLGAQYFVVGGVRSCGIRARTTVRLIEAETGVHVWADRYDGCLTDAFELQDCIAARVIGAFKAILRDSGPQHSTRRVERLCSDVLGPATFPAS
jgi:TolB-like protein